ncbi:Serine carboxypeptidase S28 [Trichostrongylus colubriformis]|uniref:Serine carboxypeptidase S28 n=1 Tax=Trichostrongylus colubriformis TaxID=6319 RepID=A0AAN8F0W8_TRICO
MFSYLVFMHVLSVVVTGSPPVMFGRPRGGFLQAPSGDGPQTEDKYMIYSNITQKVDHFGNITATWQQRYQYNRKFFNATNGIVFLMIGGEGSISPPGDKWVRDESITMMQWARKYGAAAFQLEHRFYGPKANTPFGKQDTESLMFLTIDQALADIREFIKQMNGMYFKETSTNWAIPRWVTFGGSYPGSLSAFYRETYPETTIGAISTSSAVHAFVDYYGYLQNSEANYAAQDENCAANMATAFTNMQNLFYSGVEGRNELKRRFKLCDDFDEQNLSKAKQFFFSTVISYFQDINQYSGDNRNAATRNGLGIPKACEIMTNTTLGDEMDRVKRVLDWYTNLTGGVEDCYPNNYTDYLQKYKDTSYSNIDDVVAMRSWIWQTCTELGYFQTTDYGDNTIFGSTIPVDFFSDQCIELFGPEYTLSETYRRVDAVNKKYGGATAYKGDKVVFPNGSIDPWKSIGLLKGNPDKKIDAFMIDGTAHCADMYPASPNDKKSLTEARTRILKSLDEWIQEALAPTGSVSRPGFLITSAVMLVHFILV